MEDDKFLNIYDKDTLELQNSIDIDDFYYKILYLDNKYIYIGGTYNRVSIKNIENINDIEEVASFRISSGYSYTFIGACTINNKYLYLASEGSGYIYDISIPIEPKDIGSFGYSNGITCDNSN